MSTRSNVGTQATFNDRSAELAWVLWGGTTATGKLLGQVQSFQWQNTLESRESYRVGDSTKYRTYTAEDVTWTLTLYEDDDIEEIAKIMGTTKPTAGGWASTTDIDMDTTIAAVTITIANYDSEATSATLLWTETLSSAKLNSITRNLTANEVNMWEFAGSATEVILEPEQAMGS